MNSKTPDINEVGIGTTIENVTQLYPVTVGEVYTPKSTEEIQSFIASTSNKVSTGGSRASMGGQTASLGESHIDMRGMNKVIEFKPLDKEITVQSGITWREVIESIDPHDLSIMIMQTYANFTVGGSMSVNCHGRYMGAGPLVQSIKSFRIVNAQGEIKEASPQKNAKIFYGAIGGYGVLGVITDVTLKLEDNSTLERKIETMPFEEYEAYFSDQVRGNVNIVLSNADIAKDFSKVRVENWIKSSKEHTVKSRIQDDKPNSKVHSLLMTHLGTLRGGRKIREEVIQPVMRRGPLICSRNYEATHNIDYLEPVNRDKHTFVLQEYFVPVGEINSFSKKMQETFERHDANIINVSIRNATNDPGTVLKWADGEVFAFVIYYRQDKDIASKREVGVWTRELTEAAIDSGGRYYLPYQIHHTPEQMIKAYPGIKDLISLKNKLDPDGKFSNTLYEALIQTEEIGNIEVKITDSRFKDIFQNHEWRDKFYLFLQNIFKIAPTKDVYSLIQDIVEKYNTDEEIYLQISKEINKAKPFAADIKYGIPSLKKQKQEMVNQTEELLSEITGDYKLNIDGYLEIGGFGRYIKPLKNKFSFTGETYLLSDEKVTNSPVHILERDGIKKLKNSKVLSYDNSDFENIDDDSLTLITIYIGIHHCPKENLDEFTSNLYKKLKPGGILIVRDHDAHSPIMKTMAGIAHDVFNVGTGETLERNFAEYRNFMSVEEMKNIVTNAGFKKGAAELLQDNDPTLNTLTYYQKPGRLEISNELKSDSEKQISSRKIMGLSGLFYKDYVTGKNSPTEEEIQMTQYRKTHSAHIPKEKQRDISNTFLNTSEWMSVYLPKDFGTFLNHSSPSKFPYFKHIKDIWFSYGKMSGLTKKYPYNDEAHTVNKFTSFSTALEFGVKGTYEKTIGKLSGKMFGTQTPEDKMYAEFANHYATFINTIPWYEYGFMNQFKTLWKTKPSGGRGFFRSIERRISISMELLSKTVLGKVTKKQTLSEFEPQDPETYVELEIKSPDELKNIEGVKVIKAISSGKYLVSLPRYKLTTVLKGLEGVDYNFLNIVGNTKIMVGVHGKPNQDISNFFANNEILSFDPENKDHQNRKFLYIPVSELKNFYQEAKKQGIEVEHIFDY